MSRIKGWLYAKALNHCTSGRRCGGAWCRLSQWIVISWCEDAPDLRALERACRGREAS